MERAAGRCPRSPLKLRPVRRAGCRVDLCVILSPQPGPTVELLTQDVSVTGMPGGLLK
jgi:hypothetical protein